MFIKHYKYSQWLKIISVALCLCIHSHSFSVAMLQALWSSSLHVLLRSLVVTNYMIYLLYSPVLWLPLSPNSLILDWLLFSHLCWLLSRPTTNAECLMILSPKPLFPHFLHSLWGHLLQSHANTQTVFWLWHLPKIFNSYSKCPHLDVLEAFQI